MSRSFSAWLQIGIEDRGIRADMGVGNRRSGIRRVPSFPPVFFARRVRQIALFEEALLEGALAFGRHFGGRVGAVLAARDKFVQAAVPFSGTRS